jgi:hypothetical protein
LGGNANQRAERGLAFGTYLTNLELAFVREGEFGGGQVSNASVATEAASAKGRGLVAVRAGSSEGAPLPDAARTVVRATLAEGDIAVVPVADGTGEPLTWWRVDPDSGVVLGVAASGEGQGLTENQVKAALIGVGMLICTGFAAAEDDQAKSVVKLAFCLAIGSFGMASQLTVVAAGAFGGGESLFYWLVAWALAIGAKIGGL